MGGWQAVRREFAGALSVLARSVAGWRREAGRPFRPAAAEVAVSYGKLR